MTGATLPRAPGLSAVFGARTTEPWAVVERWTLIVALAVSTTAGLPGITQSTQTTDIQSPDPTPLALWYLLYAIVAVFCLRHAREVLEVALRARWLLLVVGWALLSIFWSVSPSLTLHRAVALALTTALALLLAARYDRRQIFEMACWVLAGVLLMSVLVAVLDPVDGLDHVRGDAWRGAFNAKNQLGRIATVTAVLWLLRALGQRRRAVSVSVLALALVAIVKSDSRTSLVVIAALAVVVAALPLMRASAESTVAAAAFIAAGLGAIVYHLLEQPGIVLGALGASNTLTGRTEIWSAVWVMIKQHFWLGYGYNAFWQGLDGPSAFVWAATGGPQPNGANGFLDTWLDLGAVGVGLVALALLMTFAAAWRWLREPGSLINSWPLVFVVFLVLDNLTESSLAARNSIFWILLVAAAGSGRRRHAEMTSSGPSIENERQRHGLLAGAM